MTNPTPTPLASTAMEAAREIDRAFFDEIMGCLSKGDPLSEYVESPQVAGYAAIIQKHFQPLLAKVEETETYLASRKLISLGNGAFAAVDQPVVDLVISLRADLAAKEADTRITDAAFEVAVFSKTHAYPKELTSEFFDFATKLDALATAINARYPGFNRNIQRSALASRADKGGAR